jgi:hypothetical protein
MGAANTETRALSGAGRTPRIRRSTKLGRVLHALAQGGSWNRFEAAQHLHDWCLHSTVSALENHGVHVSRQTEAVPGYGGHTTYVTRYWLDPDARKRALELLGEAANE